MSALAVTNTFVAGAVITAAGHNQNFSDIISWANGNIGNDNLDTLDGVVTWAVTTNVLAINISNTGNQGSLDILQSTTMAASKSLAKFRNTAAQSAGTAVVEISSSSASANIPALKVTDAGAGPSAALEVVSTTKGAIPSPKMTTVQKNAITTPVAGTQVFDTTLNKPSYYSGAAWLQDLNEASVDNSTIEVNSTLLRVKDLGITAAKIANGTITTTQISGSAAITGAQLAAGADIQGTQLDSTLVVTTSLAIGTGAAIVPSTSNASYNLGGSNGVIVLSQGTSTGKGQRTLRAEVSSAGNVQAGEGFSVNKSSTGVYDVTVTTAFGDTPVVVACVNTDNGYATVSSTATTGFTIKTYTDTGTLGDKTHAWIAMGSI